MWVGGGISIQIVPYSLEIKQKQKQEEEEEGKHENYDDDNDVDDFDEIINHWEARTMSNKHNNTMKLDQEQNTNNEKMANPTTDNNCNV